MKRIVEVMWQHKLLLFLYIAILFLLAFLRFHYPFWHQVGWKGMCAICVTVGECLLLIADVIPSSFVFMLGLTIFYASGLSLPLYLSLVLSSLLRLFFIILIIFPLPSLSLSIYLSIYLSLYLSLSLSISLSVSLSLLLSPC
jgi:hypothetical protein